MDLEIRYENGSMTVHLEEFLNIRPYSSVALFFCFLYNKLYRFTYRIISKTTYYRRNGEQLWQVQL